MASGPKEAGKSGAKAPGHPAHGAPGHKKGAAQAAPKAAAFALSDGREAPHPLPRLKKVYADSVIPAMIQDFGFSNPFEVPRLVKIVINVGVTEAKENIQALDSSKEELALITGQMPQVRRAKKSISNFKLREGMPIGLRVTLRGDRMYEFLDRFISTAVPRLRDFRGFDPGAFDGRGNYNIGLREQMIFPEINSEKIWRQRGMNITIVSAAGRDDVARRLLELLGLPFRKPAAKQSRGTSPARAAAQAPAGAAA